MKKQQAYLKGIIEGCLFNKKGSYTKHKLIIPAYQDQMITATIKQVLRDAGWSEKILTKIKYGKPIVFKRGGLKRLINLLYGNIEIFEHKIEQNELNREEFERKKAIFKAINNL